MKARSIQPPTSEPERKSSGPQPVDVCELFVAEMQARRKRFQELLSMLHLEAGRMKAIRVPVHRRYKCRGERRQADA